MATGNTATRNHKRDTMTSRRVVYITFLAVTIALGLLSRSSLVPADSFICHYAGDALWALAVFWSLAIVWPTKETRWLCIATLGISLTIELSQLYHSEWIDHIRDFKPAALILGHTFLWSDLVCYTVGAIAGSLLHFKFFHKQHPTP